ncbi:MAG: hypothetical protein Q9222_007808, partial [Ikaeria aurantiellina]
MHLSTSLLFSTLFSLSLALPSVLSPRQEPRPGRLNVSYDTQITGFKTFSSGGLKAGASSTKPKASGPFTIKAYNSVSPIHMMDINASENKFFVGNKTGSACPPSVQSCPVGNVTALMVNATGGAEL